MTAFKPHFIYQPLPPSPPLTPPLQQHHCLIHCRLLHLTYRIWFIAFDLLHLTYRIWFIAFDLLHLIYCIWFIAFDLLHLTYRWFIAFDLSHWYYHIDSLLLLLLYCIDIIALIYCLWFTALLHSNKTNMYRNAHGEVQKLIGAKYLAWSEGMEFMLKGAGLWQIVSGSELPPQEPTVVLEPTPEPPASRASTTRSSATKASTSTVSESLRTPTDVATLEAYENRRREYQTPSDSAASYIYSSLSVEARKHPSGAKEPCQMWAILKTRLDSLSRNVGIVRTHTMFLNDKMVNTETISSYLARPTC